MDKIQLNQERENLISQALNSDHKNYKRILNFDWDADVNSLKKYSRINLKKRKNLRKFLKAPSRYVRSDVWGQYLGHVMCTPIRRALNYEGIGRKLLMVEELPQGAFTKYENGVLYNPYTMGVDKAEGKDMGAISVVESHGVPNKTINSENIGTSILFKPDDTIRNLYIKSNILNNAPNMNGNVYSKECLQTIANTYSNVTMTHNGLEVKFEIKGE